MTSDAMSCVRDMNYAHVCDMTHAHVHHEVQARVFCSVSNSIHFGSVSNVHARVS